MFLLDDERYAGKLSLNLSVRIFPKASADLLVSGRVI